jgi:hypothetical protein
VKFVIPTAIIIIVVIGALYASLDLWKRYQGMIYEDILNHEIMLEEEKQELLEIAWKEKGDSRATFTWRGVPMEFGIRADHVVVARPIGSEWNGGAE